jgi:phosphosulfolactate synthase
MNSKQYLDHIGVPHLPPLTTPFDPGYDPHTLKEHLRQSSHLMAGIKISMACWQIANEEVTREKVAACRAYGVKPSAGGGPLEVAAYFDALEEYLDLCAAVGLQRIEAGQGFIKNRLDPKDLVRMAADRGLEVQFELGEKHAGAFDEDTVDALLRQGHEWLEAGAKQLVIEARESANGVGLFDTQGRLNTAFAKRLQDGFGADRTVFEAPIKASQFALLDFFGQGVRLGNVRLEELLRVEIYRRGLHSDAFARENLRPRGPRKLAAAVG